MPGKKRQNITRLNLDVKRHIVVLALVRTGLPVTITCTSLTTGVLTFVGLVILCGHNGIRSKRLLESQLIHRHDPFNTLYRFNDVVEFKYHQGVPTVLQIGKNSDQKLRFEIELSSQWILHWRLITALLLFICPSITEYITTLIVRFSGCPLEMYLENIDCENYTELEPSPVRHRGCTDQEYLLSRMFPSKICYNPNKRK
jgi:hypothetical protein